MLQPNCWAYSLYSAVVVQVGENFGNRWFVLQITIAKSRNAHTFSVDADSIRCCAFSCWMTMILSSGHCTTTLTHSHISMLNARPTHQNQFNFLIPTFEQLKPFSLSFRLLSVDCCYLIYLHPLWLSWPLKCFHLKIICAPKSKHLANG